MQKPQESQFNREASYTELGKERSVNAPQSIRSFPNSV